MGRRTEKSGELPEQRLGSGRRWERDLGPHPHLAGSSVAPLYIAGSRGRHDRHGYVWHGPALSCIDQIAPLSSPVHGSVTLAIRIGLGIADSPSRRPGIDSPQGPTKCDLPRLVISPSKLAAKPQNSVPCRYFQKVGDEIGDN